VEARGAYLPSLLQAAAGNARKRLRRRADEHRTQDHARAMLARFAAGPGGRLWPWTDDSGRFLPRSEEALTPEMGGACFFALLSRAASERRSRGGPAGGLSPPLAEAGFGSAEWLPDRTDDLAIRLLTAGASAGVPRSDLLESASVLVRATLANGTGRDLPSALERIRADLPEGGAEAMLDRARARLPDLARWLEENARELLERT